MKCNIMKDKKTKNIYIYQTQILLNLGKTRSKPTCVFNMFNHYKDQLFILMSDTVPTNALCHLHM